MAFEMLVFFNMGILRTIRTGDSKRYYRNMKILQNKMIIYNIIFIYCNTGYVA